MFLLLTTALAAPPLHWRGHPYGPISALATPPGPGCVAWTEPEVRWTCPERIGTADLEVRYMVDTGHFIGVLVTCHGVSDCQVLGEILVAAWGDPTLVTEDPLGTSLVPRRIWSVPDVVIAGTTYDTITITGRLAVSATAVRAQAEAARARIAEEAARTGGL